MSSKEVDCCRLCSSNKNLMSLFSGKSRTIRDFLRKMIEETVHIQVEQCDSIPPLVCFNCSVDVSNFYFFKLHCLQNEKKLKAETSSHQLFRDQVREVYHAYVEGRQKKNIQSPAHKSKRLKLQSIYLKDLVRPDMKATETVMDWLKSKRVGLTEISKKSLNKNSQNIQIHSDVAATFPKKSQTTKSMFVPSGTQCYEVYPCLPADLKSSQTAKPKSLECPNCTKNNGGNVLPKITKSRYIQTNAVSSYKKLSLTDVKVVSYFSQTDNTFKPEVFKDSKDSCCQTDPKNLADISQTEKNKLTKNVSAPVSVITKVCTQDTSAQTNMVNLVDKDSQCDLLKLNGIKNRMIQMKEGKVTKESETNYKIADPQTFTDAILNGFDNIFVSTTTQTDITMSECDQLNCNTYLHNRDVGYLLLPHTDVSMKVDTKLNVKIPCSQNVKEEKISPFEGLLKASMEIPESSKLSPRSSDLLEVNNSKTDSVKICKLCDKSLYNKKEVTMHNKTHMQCNICKRKFRSLNATQAHIIKCKVKQISISPFVNLVRIDQLSERRDEYVRALEHLK